MTREPAIWTDDQVVKALMEKSGYGVTTDDRKLVVTACRGGRGSIDTVVFEVEGTPPRGLAVHHHGTNYVLYGRVMRALPSQCQPGSLSGELDARVRALRD